MNIVLPKTAGRFFGFWIWPTTTTPDPTTADVDVREDLAVRIRERSAAPFVRSKFETALP